MALRPLFHAYVVSVYGVAQYEGHYLSACMYI